MITTVMGSFSYNDFQIFLYISHSCCIAPCTYFEEYDVTNVPVMLHDLWRYMCDHTMQVILQLHGDLRGSENKHIREIIVFSLTFVLLLNGIFLFNEMYLKYQDYLEVCIRIFSLKLMAFIRISSSVNWHFVFICMKVFMRSIFAYPCIF